MRIQSFTVTKADIAKVFVGIIIGSLIGYSVGFAHGAVKMLDWSVGVGLNLLKLNGIEPLIDSQTMINGIMQYKNNIGQQYPQLNITEIPI